jgi:N-formylglutamate amidohydrolase
MIEEEPGNAVHPASSQDHDDLGSNRSKIMKVVDSKRLEAYTRSVMPQPLTPHEPELDPPFDLIEPASLLCPLVFSSPHSGNIYPERFLAEARLDAKTLRRSEDAFVDALFARVSELGAPLLRARFPRAYLDLNREPYELDPRMFEGRLPAFANTRSIRVAGGLGTIARVVGESHEIYARRIPVEEAIQRIERLYKPYHAALRSLLDRAHRIFGLAVLIDCHSMPSVSLQGGTAGVITEKTVKADFIVGDRYGTSCDTTLIDAVEYELRHVGYAVRRNKPYAGGFITEHYGNPAGHFHSMQIEINRALYMDEKTLSPLAQFDRVAGDIVKVATFLASAVEGLRHERPEAAE